MSQASFLKAIRLVALLFSLATGCFVLTEAATLMWPSHYHKPLPPAPAPSCKGTGVRKSYYNSDNEQQVVVCNDGRIILKYLGG